MISRKGGPLSHSIAGLHHGVLYFSQQRYFLIVLSFAFLIDVLYYPLNRSSGGEPVKGYSVHISLSRFRANRFSPVMHSMFVLRVLEDGGKV